MTQPIYIGKIIYYYRHNDEGGNVGTAYIFAGALFITIMLYVFMMHPYSLSNLHGGMKLRVAMCSMIYRKSLKLSNTALGETTAGQVVNLLSNDVSRFDRLFVNLHYLWIGPIGSIVITYLMYKEVIFVLSIVGFY